MHTTRQLRQRAEELRGQLQVTMRQTTHAIRIAMELSDDIAKRHHGQSLEHQLAKTTEVILSTRERLDLRNS